MLIKSIFDGYKAARPHRRDWEYNHLATSPYLHSSQYLSELYEESRNKHQDDCIIEHINKHDAWSVDNYRTIGQKIIDKRWK